MSEDIVKEGFALGQLLLNVDCHLRFAFRVNPDTLEHSAKDGGEETLLLSLDGFKAEDADDPCVNAVLEIVRPALFFRHVRGDLALVLPVDVPRGVEGGEEGKPLREGGVDGVLRYHRILAVGRDEVPVLMDILRVVEAVLPADVSARMGEEFVKAVDNEGFFVLAPVAARLAAGDKGDADSLSVRPGESDTVDMPVACLDVEVEP